MIYQNNSAGEVEIKRYEELVPELPDLTFAVKEMEAIYDLTGGQADLPHRHAYYTVIWILKGKGRHHIDFCDYTIKPGQLYFVRPNQVHQLILKERPKGFAILFTQEFLVNNGIRTSFISDLSINNEAGENPPLLLGESNQNLLGYVRQMLSHYKGNQPFKYEALGAFLKLFLIGAHEQCTANPSVDKVGQAGSALLVNQFKETVENHFKEKHQVKEYAAILHITANHLNDVVRSFLGTSAKQYIQDRIALEAKREALFTELTSKEVGYNLGFNDPAHFGKFFRAQTEMSFQTFREAIRKKYH